MTLENLLERLEVIKNNLLENNENLERANNSIKNRGEDKKAVDREKELEWNPGILDRIEPVLEIIESAVAENSSEIQHLKNLISPTIKKMGAPEGTMFFSSENSPLANKQTNIQSNKLETN